MKITNDQLRQLAEFILKERVCKNCKWFHPADIYFFCDSGRVPFIEQGLGFTDEEIEYWGCNQWETK